jgi:hypothetical protein
VAELIDPFLAMTHLKTELVRVGIVDKDWDIYVWGYEGDVPTKPVTIRTTDDDWVDIA